MCLLTKVARKSKQWILNSEETRQESTSMASGQSSSNSQDANNRALVSHYSNPSLDNKYLSNPAASSRKVVCDDMIYYCFDVLHSHLHKNPDHPQPKFANNQFPLFVTWYTGKEKRLRGCIGTFTPLDLHDGLKEYAITSAIRDSRFDPIAKDELAKLNCSVSLLHNFEPTKAWHDWVQQNTSHQSNYKNHKRANNHIKQINQSTS